MEPVVAADAPVPAIERATGFPVAIDTFGRHDFLRASWFAAGAQGAAGETLVARRTDGTPILAIPTIAAGPALVGLRTVPGSYWPFRAVPVARDATLRELVAVMAHRTTRELLAPAWRLGPVYAEDPAIARLRNAATRAGWHVLSRIAGRTFRIALPPGGQAWPGRGTARRIAAYRRRLAAQGEVTVRHVTGAGWTDDMLDRLGAIEARSWIATATDGSGAKFLHPHQRAAWRQALGDPVLGRALSATILSVGEKAIAFSFDLRDGDTQYAIASSYDAAFAAWRPGRIVTCAQLARARDEGIVAVDLGAGDSGYKGEMGAVPGSAIEDLLFVRNRAAAALLRQKWSGGLDFDRWDFDRIEPWLKAGAIAAAALALSE